VLGIREESVSRDAPGLAGLLADKQALLVLDNCEQIIGACAELAETLLRSCPELRILATSRQALRIAGEATLTVQPLTVPDSSAPATPAALAQYESASLLADRAAAVLPGFSLDEQNAATVARLCRTLEGMPLAIELAASRLRVLSLEQILDRLTDRYRLLTTGPRTAPARQQTLSALVDWSWDLCSEAERTLWARLSVFSGGLELDAAEEVCADADLPSESILDLIASLVDKSVLMRVGDGRRVRYRMLEVIREYGAARLAASGEQPALRRRHCEWYAGLATRGDAGWVGPHQAELMARLRHEQGNLRIALEFAVAEGPPELALRFAAGLENHWFVQGFLSEGRHWLDRALAMPPPRHWTRVKALRVNAWIAFMLGDRRHADTLLAEAHELAAILPPSVELAYLSMVQGGIEMFVGDHRAARPLVEKALAGFRATGARSGEMWALAALGLTRGLASTPSDGFADLLACRDLAAAHGEVWWRSIALWALSVLRLRAGDTAGADEAAKECLEVGQIVPGEQLSVGLALESLAWIAATERRDERAAQLLGASDRRWRAMHASLSVLRSLYDFHDACVREVRGRLGDKAYEAACVRGAELSTADAIELALERHGRPSAPAPRAAEPAAKQAAAFGLTRREREVATLIAEGLSNREIAARLVVAQRTAEGHVENILSKLGFTSRAQVAGWLAAQGQAPGVGGAGPA
jgi:non-specific serine/threonine protein kinase